MSPLICSISALYEPDKSAERGTNLRARHHQRSLNSDFHLIILNYEAITNTLYPKKKRK